jgi:hypothetical protein
LIRRPAGRVASLLASAGLLLLSSTARAKPQWNAGLETALCARGSGSRLGFAALDWCNALHADVLFLRERSTDFGLGPSLRLGSVGFDDLRLDGGLSVLLPLLADFPLVIEAGPQLRNFSQPGVFGSACFGLRSFNHYGHYEMATGLVFTAERSFVSSAPSVLWIGARIDGSWLALPFVFAYNALK